MLMIFTSAFSQTLIYSKHPFSLSKASLGDIDCIYGNQLYIGLHHKPARYVYSYNFVGEVADFNKASITELFDCKSESMQITSLTTDTVATVNNPYVLLTGTTLAASVAPAFPAHKIFIGVPHRPAEAIYARSIEAENITVSNQLLGTANSTIVNYDHFPNYPDASYFNYDTNDSVDFSLSYDATNYKNYVEALTFSAGTSLQFADVVIQQECPNGYADFASDFINLQYCTEQQDTAITYVNIKIYEDNTLLYQTYKFCSALASVWGDTTIAKSSGSISDLAEGDNMILRIEVGAKYYTSSDQWVRLSRLKINFGLE